jgi:hypothetical protein
VDLAVPVKSKPGRWLVAGYLTGYQYVSSQAELVAQSGQMLVKCLDLMQLDTADFPGPRVGRRQNRVMNGLPWVGHCVRRLLVSLLEFGLGKECHVMNLPIVVALLLSPARDFLAVVLDQELG